MSGGFLNTLIRRSIIIFPTIIFIGVILITSGVITADEQSDKHKERAQEVAQSFMGQLQSILMEELRAGGPVQALSVCADTAQELTRSIGESYNVSIKRVSDHVRNSDNTPDEYESTILALFRDMTEDDETPPFIHTGARTVNDEKEFWYMQSIHLQAQCVGCHGQKDQIAETVMQLLNEKYPDDKATGYKPGDFRGAIRVSFKIDE